MLRSVFKFVAGCRNPKLLYNNTIHWSKAGTYVETTSYSPFLETRYYEIGKKDVILHNHNYLQPRARLIDNSDPYNPQYKLYVAIINVHPTKGYSEDTLTRSEAPHLLPADSVNAVDLPQAFRQLEQSLLCQGSEARELLKENVRYSEGDHYSKHERRFREMAHKSKTLGVQNKIASSEVPKFSP